MGGCIKQAGAWMAAASNGAEVWKGVSVGVLWIRV